MSLFFLFFCDSFLCSISLLFLSVSLPFVLKSGIVCYKCDCWGVCVCVCVCVCVHVCVGDNRVYLHMVRIYNV